MISIHNCRYCYLYGRVVYNLRYHQVVSLRSSHSTDYVDTASCRGAISNYHFTLVAFLYNTDLFYRYRQPSTMVFYVSLHVTVRLTGECKPRGVRIPDNVTFLASRPIYIYARATCSIIRIRLKTSKPPSSRSQNFIRQRRSKSRRYLDGRMDSRHLSQQSTFLFR